MKSDTTIAASETKKNNVKVEDRQAAGVIAFGAADFWDRAAVRRKEARQRPEWKNTTDRSPICRSDSA
jgi:hypothetical protein